LAGLAESRLVGYSAVSKKRGCGKSGWTGSPQEQVEAEGSWPVNSLFSLEQRVLLGGDLSGQESVPGNEITVDYGLVEGGDVELNWFFHIMIGEQNAASLASPPKGVPARDILRVR
jgi:hypothetical protein